MSKTNFAKQSRSFARNKAREPPLPSTRQRGARLRYTRPYQIKVQETKQRFMFSRGQMGCSFSRKRGCLYNCTSGHASHFAPDKCHTNSRNVRYSTPPPQKKERAGGLFTTGCLLKLQFHPPTLPQPQLFCEVGRRGQTLCDMSARWN